MHLRGPAQAQGQEQVAIGRTEAQPGCRDCGTPMKDMLTGGFAEAAKGAGVIRTLPQQIRVVEGPGRRESPLCKASQRGKERGEPTPASPRHGGREAGGAPRNALPAQGRGSPVPWGLRGAAGIAPPRNLLTDMGRAAASTTAHAS